MKPVLISGIQPTGQLHLGNYLGALKHFVDLQNSGRYDCFFFIADLHSLTEPFSPREKEKQITDLLANYIAAGIDPKKSVLFLQSAVPSHTELAWIFNTITPFGELRRMTQFKDKSFGIALSEVSGKVISANMSLHETDYKEHTKKVVQEEIEKYVNVGLFDYPVLMAADIVLYDAKYVPVGDDQVQHLELARTLARKFNSRFGKTFVEPQPLLTEVPRLMSLDNPEKKMSKSQPAGCLFLDDSPDAIRAKIKRAVTDSGKTILFDPVKKPAISNLLLIYSALSGHPISKIEREFTGKGYGEFKHTLAEVAVDAFEPFQKQKKALLKNTAKLRKLLTAGNRKALKIATTKIEDVKARLGLPI